MEENSYLDTNGYPRRFGDRIPDLKKTMEEGDGLCELESPELDYNYEDCDTQVNEIAELYSYTEFPEFQQNVKAFEDIMEEFNFPPSWQKLSELQKKAILCKLIESLETTNCETRMHAARCVLYLVQGCWAEVQSDEEQQHWARSNTMLLYKMGMFTIFVDLLNLEIEKSNSIVIPCKIAKSIADSENLRVILSVLYTITEYMRTEKENPLSEYKDLIDDFDEELHHPHDDEFLIIKLLGMVTVMCAGTPRHYPIKKVLLLLWKLLLVFLGGSKELKKKKADMRKQFYLSEVTEDTLEIVKMMRSSSPPPNAVDVIENQNQNQKRPERQLRRQTFMKQTSLDETAGDETNEEPTNDSEDYNIDFSSYENKEMMNANNENLCEFPNDGSNEPFPMRILPWKPKVRQRDIDNFLENVRLKFVGFTIPGDRTTLAGLPPPIHEGVKILNNYVYTSVADIQIDREIEIARSPFTKGEKVIEETEAELLYRAMLPNLPQHMIALLKIILAAAPSSTAKTHLITITADVLPEEMPLMNLESVKLGIDVARHKEIIIKAVSAVLLLLLKHFKVNHIYQFEFMSQHLVYANCIPLILKCFNQNILSYVSAKSTIPIFEFPTCVIGEQPDLTKESFEIGHTIVPYSSRNMFSCINLLRIFNKLTKFKSARIMMMLVFKSAPILKRTLKVRHALMQYYVLKLLKMQSKYLGRQWRKSNMKTISAIYAKVRHRLNDDWAYGNDIDVRPWDFQDEESALRMCVDRFNHRRYGTPIDNDLETTPSEKNLHSALDVTIELDDEFKNNYEQWLEHEVFSNAINWDVLLA